MSSLLDGDTVTVAIASLVPTLLLAVLVTLTRRLGVRQVAQDAQRLRHRPPVSS